MANRGSSSEKAKRAFLAVLGVALLAVFIYQFVLKGTSEKPKHLPQAGVTTPGAPPPPLTSASAVPPTRQLGAAAAQEALMQQLLSDTTPLNLKLASSDGAPFEPGSRGNVFAYYVAPPPPPASIPPPPPIQLVSLQPQSAVAGTPRTVTLIVGGNKIPADAQILLDGAPRVTKRLSDNQLSTEIAPGDYVSQRNINVGVRSQSDPKENSNTIPFVVQPGPEPQFVFKGRLGPLGQPQYNYAVFELAGGKEFARAKVGDTVTGVWRIDAIAADFVDLTHTQYEIKRRLPLQEKAR
jgi:hypothetical protein